jgi:hypothetical protein
MIVIITIGIGVVWWGSDVKAADTWWRIHGSTVLKSALPLLSALIIWIAKQMVAVRPVRSTPEQLLAAQKALSGRGLEWWRGIPEPSWPAQPLRAGLRPLDVMWSKVGVDHFAVGKGPIHGWSSNVPGLVAQFRAAYPCRLVVKGNAGAGKSVLARMMMAELLKNPLPGEPVPVFLPLWSWSPREEQLGDVATYGPTAVASLVDQGGILPVLDGLDALPMRDRETVLADGALMAQDRLILTYRAADFDRANGFIVIEPRSVSTTEAGRFLSQATGLDASSFTALPVPVTDPRIVYLASIIYRKTDTDTSPVTPNGATSPVTPNGAVPAVVPNGAVPAPDFSKIALLGRLIPSLMPVGGDWARQFPWYADRAEGWLSNLAQFDLRDPGDRTGEFDPDEPGDSRIAWWNLYLALPRLRAWQAYLRATLAGLFAFALIVLVFRNDLLFYHFKAADGWRYSLFTAGTYGLIIFVVGVVFGRELPVPERETPFSGGGRLTVSWWWVKNAVRRHGRMIAAGLLGFVLLGSMLGIRTGLSSGASVGLRTAIGNGFVQGAVLVILIYVIAHVPHPPRTARVVDRGYVSRHDFRSFLKAMILGVIFGVLWGVNVVFRHQHHVIPPLRDDVLTGLLTGVNFALGTWFVGWALVRLRSMPAPDPKRAARADLVGTAACALILGVTFAFAFGINAPFPSKPNLMDLTAWFIVGLALGILGSEWPLYAMAITWLSLKKRALPLRLMRFLDCCRTRGIVRVVGQEYQLHDNDLLEYLSSHRPKGPAHSPGPLPLPGSANITVS